MTFDKETHTYINNYILLHDEGQEGQEKAQEGQEEARDGQEEAQDGQEEARDGQEEAQEGQEEAQDGQEEARDGIAKIGVKTPNPSAVRAGRAFLNKNLNPSAVRAGRAFFKIHGTKLFKILSLTLAIK